MISRREISRISPDLDNVVLVLIKLIYLTFLREIYCFQERVQERPITFECLLVLDEASVPDDLNLQSVRVVRISSTVMKKLSGLQSIDSIEMIALMKIPSTFHSVDDEFLEEDCTRWFQNAHRILVLDGIQVIWTLILVTFRIRCFF